MLKKLLIALFATVMVICLVGCGTAGQATTPTNEVSPASTPSAETSTEPTATATATATAVEYKPVQLTFTTSGTQAENASIEVQKMADSISQESGGKVQIKTYFSAALVAQDQEIPSTMAGNIDICITDPGTVANYVSDFKVFTVPYLFTGYDQWQKYQNSDLGKQMDEKIVQVMGLRKIAAYYVGARGINLRVDKKVTSRADLSGVKLRVMNTKAWLAIGTALGANPMPLAFGDLYLALQTGTVDGQDNPITTSASAAFQEATKSYTHTNHFLGTQYLLINDKNFQSLEPQTQDLILKYAAICQQNISERNLSGEKELDTTFGIPVYTLTDAELASLQKEVVDAFFSVSDNTEGIDMDVFHQIQSIK